MPTGAVRAGQFAAACPWASGAEYKQSLLEYPHACCLSVFVRDKSEGTVAPDAEGRPKIVYSLNDYDRRTMVQVDSLTKSPQMMQLPSTFHQAGKIFFFSGVYYFSLR